MVATGEEMEREKNSSRSGNFTSCRKNLYLWNKSGENEILRVHAY